MSPIPSMIYNAAVGGHVTNSQQIIDENENKEQSQINAEVKQTLGQGGSVDERINQAKSDIIGGASSGCDTLGEAEAKINANESAISAEVLRSQAAEALLQSQYNALTQSDIIVGALPSSGVANMIYRVPGTSSYSDYMWYGGAFVLMATYNNAIDNDVASGSDNLVKNKAVAKMVGLKRSPMVQGNGTSWATATTIDCPFLHKDVKYRITVRSSGEVTLPSGIDDGKVTFCIELRDSNGHKVDDFDDARAISPNHINNGDTFDYSPKVDCYAYFEGRWPSNVSIYLEIEEIITSYNIVLAGDIIADNYNRTLYLPISRFYAGGYLGTSTKAVSSLYIPYSDMPASSTTFWVIYYDIVNNMFKVGAWYNRVINNRTIIIGKVLFDGDETYKFIYSASSPYASIVIKGTRNSVIERNAYKDPAIRSVGRSGLGFIHISDTHVKELDGKGYVCVRNVKKLMDKYPNLKFCINTGDLVYDTFADSMEWYDLGLQGSNKLYLNTIGNHDAGQENASVGYLASVGSDTQVYDKFIAPYKNNWNLGSGDTGKNYYYKDFTDDKVRLIVLYQFETDFELNQEGTRLKYYREACTVRQAQVDWLISTLESVPEDYGVIVACHAIYKLDNSDNAFTTPYLRNYELTDMYQYSSDPQWMEKILSAYQNKESVNISWNQTGGVVTSLIANHDFSNAKGDFITILSGHYHNDFIGHPYGFPNLNLIVIGSDNLIYTGETCKREYDTVSEDLINLVSVNRTLKTITIIRIGSDFSIYGQKRDYITLNY